MWALYIMVAALTAGITLKVAHPLLDKGRYRHGAAVTATEKRLAVALVAFLPLAALMLYLLLGRPDLPGRPRIFSDLNEMDARHYALLAQQPMERILKNAPHDAGAYAALGQINYKLGDFAAAIPYFRKAVEIAKEPEAIELRLYAVALGETQVMAAGGIVGDDAIETFEYVRMLYPESPIARYYLALSQSQRGEEEAAIAEWTRLLSEGPPGIYWKKRIREQMAALKKKMRRGPAP